MPAGAARATDEITDNLRSLVDRLVDAGITQELARRGQEVAGLLAERGGELGSRADEAWRDSRPVRRDAGRRLSRAANGTARSAEKFWRRSLRPALRDAWKRRTVAMGAAGAAVPVGRELVDTAAGRLGLRQREERHWGAFFLGLILGAVGGAVVAMLTTPRRGSEMRRELGARAEEVAAKAKDEWVPIFQREETNGHTAEALPGETLSGTETSATNLQEGAAEAGSATGEAADQAAADTADAINESYDTVDRESPA